MTPDAPNASEYLLLTGSFTSDGGGDGAGIGILHAAEDGTLAVVDTAVGEKDAPSPSFLARHPRLPMVYAVGEFAQTVRAFHVIDGDDGPEHGPTVEPAGEPWTAGESACHVAVDPEGRYLVVACWGDGQVICYELDESGGIVNRIPAPPAHDPHGDTGRPSRAHAAFVLGDGTVLTTDLGFDLVRVWRYEPGSGLVADHEVVLPEGTGPRHAVLHPDGYVYVAGELSIDVHVLERGDDRRFRVIDSSPATKDLPTESDAAAEISIDEDATHVYVSVRSSDRISTLAVRDGGARLEPVADVPCGGGWPRHHWQRGRLMLVANQKSSTISALRIDPETGVPAEVMATVPSGSPSCFLQLD